MEPRPPACISSFVIRFVVEQPDPGPDAAYRGTIRHVQSDEQLSFRSWDEAVVFIQRFVPLEPASGADER